MSNSATMDKVHEMTQGHIVVMSDNELDLLAKFDVGNVIRSRPNPKQIGTLDRWECWIEQRDLARFSPSFGY